MARMLRGVDISPGVGRGISILWTPEVVAVPLRLDDRALDTEIRRFHRALEDTRRQLMDLRRDVETTLGASHAFIIETQLHFIDDRMLTERVESIIRDQQTNAEWALELALRELAQRFAEIADPYLRERISDIQDVIRRLQASLAGYRTDFLEELEGPVILVGQDLAPSQLLEWLHHTEVRGIVLESSSSTSHVAIMARALGIPTVGGIHGVLETIRSGLEVLVDGYEGTVILDPTPLQIREFESKKKYFAEHLRALAQASQGPAVTRDGFRVRLHANLEEVHEVEAALRYGAEGIGLFRSEYIYLRMERSLPGEDDHYRWYRELLRRFPDKPVTIRLADIGADKVPLRMEYPKVMNPALGMRALRLGMRRREILDPQIRALLRLGAEYDLRILLPFISAVEEVMEMLEIIDENRRALHREGRPHRADVPVGIMVEIPSIAMMIPEVSPFIDFLSLGTNDLVQFMMAVDRGYEPLRYLYRPFHPPVLRLLAEVIRSGRDRGLDVSVCGEMAADIPSVLLLVGLGCPVLSMVPQWIPAIHYLVTILEQREVAKLARETLSLATGKEVEEMLLEWIQSHYPEGIYHRLLRHTHRRNRTPVPSEGEA